MILRYSRPSLHIWLDNVDTSRQIIITTPLNLTRLVRKAFATCGTAIHMHGSQVQVKPAVRGSMAVSMISKLAIHGIYCNYNA